MWYLILVAVLAWGIYPWVLLASYHVLGKPLLALAMYQYESSGAATAAFRENVLAAIRTFPRRHWVLSLWLLAIIGYYIATTPYHNPFAHDALTIRGRFPFDKGYELVFRQNAYGNAQWYRRWCGGINTDNAICREGYRYLTPTRIDANHYSITIYRDRYIPWFADWREETWHIQYKAHAGADPAQFGATSYGDPENSVCDDSDELLKDLRNKLFCTGQLDAVKFKHLTLTEGQPVSANEKLMNFWLFSELRAVDSKGINK